MSVLFLPVEFRRRFVCQSVCPLVFWKNAERNRHADAVCDVG